MEGDSPRNCGGADQVQEFVYFGDSGLDRGNQGKSAPIPGNMVSSCVQGFRMNVGPGPLQSRALVYDAPQRGHVLVVEPVPHVDDTRFVHKTGASSTR